MAILFFNRSSKANKVTEQNKKPIKCICICRLYDAAFRRECPNIGKKGLNHSLIASLLTALTVSIDLSIKFIQKLKIIETIFLKNCYICVLN